MTARLELAVDRAGELLDRQIGLRSEPTQQYVDRLSSVPDALQELLNRVTVQETAFFRHPTQFDALIRHVLVGRSTPVTIWSAGCANGQEPQSLAMVLDELGLDGTVIATDISTNALERTARATYSTRELSGLSDERLCASGRPRRCGRRRTDSRWSPPRRATSTGVRRGGYATALDEPETLTRKADHALYRAKAAGRNRIPPGVQLTTTVRGRP